LRKFPLPQDKPLQDRRPPVAADAVAEVVEVVPVAPVAVLHKAVLLVVDAVLPQPMR
jgi:hypothetical protein